jgi:acyl-CoA thioesterase FadM
MFDDASYHFFHAMLGWTGASDDEGRIAWVDARDLVEYKSEVEAGDLLEIHAGLKKIGTKSITVHFEMTNLGKNELAATMDIIYVLFDLQKRIGVALTDEIREKVSAHLVE